MRLVCGQREDAGLGLRQRSRIAPDGTLRKVQEIQEYDVVRLRRDLPQVGLAQGTEGTVVNMLNNDGEAFEVEVVDRDGSTLFLGTLSADDLERVWTPGETA